MQVPPRRKRRTKTSGASSLPPAEAPDKPPRFFRSLSGRMHKAEDPLKIRPIVGEPPQAEVYMNLIAEEDKYLSNLLDTESESDSGSNVSTVGDCGLATSSVITPSSPDYYKSSFCQFDALR